MTSADPNLHALDLLIGSEAGFALSILDASPDCIKLLDLQGRLCFMNGNGLCAMEIDDFASVDQRAWPTLWPPEATGQVNQAMQAARQGQVSRFEAFCPTARGTARWWHVTVSPVRDDRGQVHRILASSRDITETVEARQQMQDQATRLAAEIAQKDQAIARQDILMGEIDHRVKNSFSAVIGLLRMQARVHSGSPAGALLVDAANRISTLARVHEQLHRDPANRHVSLSGYITALATDLTQALNARLDLDNALSPLVRVSASQAAAIGQVLAELIGNAVKHTREGQQPSLLLGLSRQGDLLTLTLDDDGPGLPDGFDPSTTAGLGMQICLIYAQQMGGSLQHGRSDRGGARFQVQMVLDMPLTS
ncbi:sensor histidine kinase [Paracoccus nototheniae]|uniref:histidine kinase n=1 Tax=Paracoccus nototheniae TaxID=2489002 RepID=A0ABW4DVJ9_9RHOB|nr:PAS domain-containing protein [Paracoccus nototheniae]